MDTIYTDFHKAFDQVSHSILVQKLYTFINNKRMINWFISYLMDRRQLVVVNGSKSGIVSPPSGLPQGSTLGPFLFIMFINDLPDIFGSFCSLFADDMKLCRRIIDNEDASGLQQDLNALDNWCANNGLNLNVAKCTTLSFSRKRNILECIYKIGDQQVTRANSVNDLGVTFDHRLSFKEHIDNIVNQSLRMLGFILRITKSFKNIKTLVILYNALVRSKLEYCCQIWGPYYDIYIEQLERVQRKFTRALYYRMGLSREDYTMRLKKLAMISLTDRRIIADEILLWKILNIYELNALFRQHLSFADPQRYTRHNSMFYLPTVTTNVEYYSPLLRIQRSHDTYFRNINLALPGQTLSAFRRIIISQFS